MTAPAVLHPAIAVRTATETDNEALVALTAACPMAGDIRMCVDRRPDFFALNRLEGHRWRVGVVDGADRAITGCVAVAERLVYLHGEPRRTMYLSDLKVHPDHRGGAVADTLSRYCREQARQAGGDHLPTLLMVLAGNRPMERRAAGPRGLPPLTRFASLQAHAVTLLAHRRVPATGVTISRAEPHDLDDMADLWRRVAPGRQFAPVFDAHTLARWIALAPGLALSDYWLARRATGRLRGFLALWDQSCFKQLRVLGYSRSMRLVRAGVNLAAPLLGAPRLPPVGAALRHQTAVHVCVAADDVGVLRALVIQASNAARDAGYSFITIGLDQRDPLAAALKGLLAQPTRVHAYATTPGGPYAGPALDDRPLHFEIALV